LSILYYISGFLYNFVCMAFCALPMAMRSGQICVNRKKFIWDVTEFEYLDDLAKEDE
jgi:hypothetical protein